PVSSLLSPLLSLMVFIIGTLYELRRISGCVSVREWMQSQVNEQTNEDLHLDFDDVNFDYVDFYRTNPATGLAMHGGFDSAGNTFGKRKLTAVCSHQTRIGNLDAHLI
ncbi:hypothetical protein ACM2MK_28495, partial [Escherichia coli]